MRHPIARQRSWTSADISNDALRDQTADSPQPHDLRQDDRRRLTEC
jgi:hypothetical protein